MTNCVASLQAVITEHGTHGFHKFHGTHKKMTELMEKFELLGRGDRGQEDLNSQKRGEFPPSSQPTFVN